jgi:hypothetical protein
MRTVPRSEQEQRLVAAMRREYGADCDPETIAARVHAEYDRLCRESRVDEFVPILAERRVRGRLNRESTTERHSGVAGVAPEELAELQRAAPS